MWSTRSRPPKASTRAWSISWALPRFSNDNGGSFQAEYYVVPNVDSGFGAATQTLHARYEWPYQAHAPMGPSCAVADVQADAATVWSSRFIPASSWSTGSPGTATPLLFIFRTAPVGSCTWRLAQSAAQDGWRGLLVGDMGAVRGGPMKSGHASHQIGLDVDLWFEPMPAETLSAEERARHPGEGLRHFGNNIAQFERSYEFKQHDHLLCTKCNKVIEFCDPRIQNIKSTVGELLDFHILHHSLNLYGICGDCRAKKATEEQQHEVSDRAKG